MSEIYNYYYIGRTAPGVEEEGLASPVLLTFSKMKNGLPGEVKPHSHPYLEVFFFESGSGFFECGGDKVAVEAGDALAVSAGKKHVQYSGGDTPLIYYCFAATNVSLSSVGRPDSFGERGYALVKKDKSSSFYPLITACKRELDEEKMCCGQTASAYLKLLLIEIYRALPSDPIDRRVSAVSGIKTYIEAHCNEDISLDAICRKFYINKTNLLHTFKREFGTSPVRYLNNYRIERSKELLAGGESVTSAALAVGFSNPVYFTELFHRRTGLTPSAFRKISEINR
jgi:transcriptional regulator, araC family